MRAHALARIRHVIVGSTLLAGCVVDGAASSDPTGRAEPPPRAGHYASPDGSAAGAGTLQSPWDLATALAGAAGRIGPGDTLWLRGGTYAGAFRSELAGAADAPIVVRALPGERATLDGAGSTYSTLNVAGPWTVFWGLEVTNSDPNRSRARPTSVYASAPHTRFINLVVHDGGVGLYTGHLAAGVEVYGSIFYNNGWRGPTDSRGHGHAIYAKNSVGTQFLGDNVVFNQFGYGIHAYTGEGRGHLRGIRMEGNIAFNNGSIASADAAGSANLLLGGEEPVEGSAVSDNLTYYSPAVGVTNMILGYGSVANVDVQVRNNLMVGGSRVLTLERWGRAEIADNHLFGEQRIVVLQDSTSAGLAWRRNWHYRDAADAAWTYRGRDFDFSGWRTATGLGEDDRVEQDPPAGPWVVIRPNRYEPGRAHVAIYNRGGERLVTLNLSGVLQEGDEYELHNVQDLFGPPVAAGTYGPGGISVPLRGVDPPPPLGGSPARPPRTGPEFDVFLLRRLPAGA